MFVLLLILQIKSLLKIFFLPKYCNLIQILLVYTIVNNVKKNWEGEGAGG